MKVLLVNGSPHKDGSTNRALEEIAMQLEKEGVEAEIFWLGNKPISGCIACLTCSRKDSCVFDDVVNEFAAMAEKADGFVFGSPVHYASASGAITSFMDRLFYSSGSKLALKPAACVCAARRGGTTATFDQLMKYFTINQMPVVSSTYWNMVHGRNAQDVEQDLEGLRTMRTLAKNMAWLLKSIEAGKAAGVEMPEPEEVIFTNFIR